jgi:hypothetical protein
LNLIVLFFLEALTINSFRGLSILYTMTGCRHFVIPSDDLLAPAIQHDGSSCSLVPVRLDLLQYSTDDPLPKYFPVLTRSGFQNLVWTGECNCQKAHREWFAVSVEVAKQTVKRLIDFVNHAYDKNGSLNVTWSHSIEELGKVDSEEMTKRIEKDLQRHHELRHRRYESWLADAKLRYHEAIRTNKNGN